MSQTEAPRSVSRGDLGCFARSLLILDDGDILLGSMTLDVRLVKPDWSVAWKVPVPASVLEVAHGLDGGKKRYFAGCGDGTLVCLGAKGKLIWEKKLSWPVWNLTSDRAGNLYASSQDTPKILRFTMGGKQTLDTSIEGGVASMSASSNGTIVAAGTLDGELFVLDMDGDELDIQSQPRAERLDLSPDGRYLAMASGPLLTIYVGWRQRASVNVGSEIVAVRIGGGRVVAMLRRSVVCLDLDGKVIWTWTNPHPRALSTLDMTVDGKTILVADPTGSAFRIEP